MTYELIDGTSCTLAHHTLDEWRDVQRQRMIGLGCSREFAEKHAAHYTEAPRRAEAEVDDD